VFRIATGASLAAISLTLALALVLVG